jgi:hypothetical protein
MQIACKRFSCQKAVEVCYWSCKYRRTCKDWSNALNVAPGIELISERLESAAAKSGRTFEATTLLKPVKPKRKLPIERKLMAKPMSEEIKTENVKREESAPKTSKAPVVSKAPPKPKPASDGTVYLLLTKNGKYRELRESQLIKEAAVILKDPTLRLFKGQYLVPHITFRPQGE